MVVSLLFNLLALITLTNCEWSNLVVGGDFAVVDSQQNIVLSGLVSYNKELGSWSAVGGGIPFVLNNRRVGYEVAQLQDSSLGLIVSGFFYLSWNNGASNVSSIGIWDGIDWHDMHGGVTGGGSISQFLLVENDNSSALTIYICGYFQSVGAGVNVVAAQNIAAWKPHIGWSALGEGIGGWFPLVSPGTCFHFPNGTGTISGIRVVALTYRQQKLYVGGTFTQAGGLSSNHSAVWDVVSQSWASLTPSTGFVSNGSDSCCAVMPVFDFHPNAIYSNADISDTEDNWGATTNIIKRAYLSTLTTSSSLRALLTPKERDETATSTASPTSLSLPCIEMPPPGVSAFCCNTTFGMKGCCDVGANVGISALTFTVDGTLLGCGSFSNAGSVPTPTHFIQYSADGTGEWLVMPGPSSLSGTAAIATDLYSQNGTTLVTFNQQAIWRLGADASWQPLITNNGTAAQNWAIVTQISLDTDGGVYASGLIATTHPYTPTIMFFNNNTQSWEPFEFESLIALGYVSDGYIPRFVFTQRNYGGVPYTPSVSDEGSSHNIGVIVGPVVGGIVLILVVIYCCFRRGLCSTKTNITGSPGYSSLDDENKYKTRSWT